MRDHVLTACQLDRGVTRALYEASSIHTLIQMVAAGVGVTFIPNIAATSQLLKGMDIHLAPVVGRPCRKIGLVWRESSPRFEEMEALGGVLRRAHSC